MFSVKNLQLDRIEFKLDSIKSILDNRVLYKPNSHIDSIKLNKN